MGENVFKIEVYQAEFSVLWHWRVVGAENQPPIIVSNGYVEESACRTNLEYTRRAFMGEIT